MSKKDTIIKDVEALMVQILMNDIPERDVLKNNHTLKNMDFWKGGDVSVIEHLSQRPKPNGFYPQDNFIISNKAYEVSWVICELRDIFIKNNFYDFDNKFILFGTFADNYKRHQRSSLRTNRQWFENVDQWLIEKFILIRALEDMIYTHKYAFLPCDCSKTECKEDPVDGMTAADIMIGAQG